MSTRTTFQIGAYAVEGDLHYDAETHLWVSVNHAGIARCGFDPLGSETSGDIVAVAFDPVGRTVTRGRAFGSLEAAKFVGPLISPLSGVIQAQNDAVLRNPASLNDEPFAHWMIEIDPSDLEAELAQLVSGEDAVREWFAEATAKFKAKGMIAE
jgi:glycine cleavage system H protein